MSLLSNSRRPFATRTPTGNSYIGIGVRSQHYYANFAHMLYLNFDGRIVITEQNESPANFYEDNLLRGPTSIKPSRRPPFFDQVRSDESCGRG